MVGLISTVWNLCTSHVVMYCEVRRSRSQVSFSKIVYDVASLYRSREQSYCFTDFGIVRPTQIPSCGPTVRWQIPSSLSCPFPAQFISKPTILNSSTFILTDQKRGWIILLWIFKPSFITALSNCCFRVLYFDDRPGHCTVEKFNDASEAIRTACLNSLNEKHFGKQCGSFRILK